MAIHPLLSKFRKKSSSSNRSAARQRRKDKEEPTRGKMTAHAQWQERKERDEPTADDHKLPQSSHFYACFSMLEPKYVMGYCLSQLGEKAPELIRGRHHANCFGRCISISGGPHGSFSRSLYHGHHGCQLWEGFPFKSEDSPSYNEDLGQSRMAIHGIYFVGQPRAFLLASDSPTCCQNGHHVGYY